MDRDKKVRGLRGSAGKAPPPPEFDDMAKRLREERERLGLTQEQLGAKAGVSQANVSNMERAASAGGVRLVSVFRVAKALGWSLDQMVLGHPNFLGLLMQAAQSGAIKPIELGPMGSASESVEAQNAESAPTPKRQPKRRRR